MMINETITEAPKDCDDSGAIWESGKIQQNNIASTGLQSFILFDTFRWRKWFHIRFFVAHLTSCHREQELLRQTNKGIDASFLQKRKKS